MGRPVFWPPSPQTLRMQPPLQPNAAPIRSLGPVARLPLHVNRDGSMMEPEVAVDDARGVVYVSQPVDPASLMDWAVWRAPDAALMVLVIAPVLLARHLLRVRGRPQRPGVLHCRRCNYELTPDQSRAVSAHEPGSDTPPVCSECGRPLVKPAIGRTPIERTAGPVLLTLLVVALSAGSIALTVEKPRWPGATLWPAPIASRVFPSLRYQKIDRGTRPERLITRFQLPDGEPIGRAWRVDAEFIISSELSPQGDFYVVTTSDWTRTNPHSSAVIFSTATGERLGVDVGGGNLTPTIRGFSRDGTGVYIQTQFTDTAGPSLFCDASLFKIDLHTGRRTDVTKVTSPMLTPANPQMPQQYFVPFPRDGQGDRAQDWVLYSHTTTPRTAAGPQTGEVIIQGNGTEPPRRLQLSFSGSSFYPPTITEDGTTLLMDLYGTPTPTSLSVNLATGAYQEVPAAHPAGILQTRTKSLIVQQVGTVPGAPPVRGATIADRSTGLPLAHLPDAPFPASLRLSPSGLWAYTTAMSTPSAAWWTELGIGGSTKGEVLVWDLKDLSAMPNGKPHTPTGTTTEAAPGR